MAGILGNLFGADTLKKAASTGDTSTSAPSSSANVDIGKMAQDAADTAKAAQFKGAPYPKTPSGLSSTMTPQKNNGKK